MVEQAAYNSDFLATFPLYYRDSPVPRRKEEEEEKEEFSSRRESARSSTKHTTLLAYTVLTIHTRGEKGRRGERRSNVTRSQRRPRPETSGGSSRKEKKKSILCIIVASTMREEEEKESAQSSRLDWSETCIYTHATRRRGDGEPWWKRRDRERERIKAHVYIRGMYVHSRVEEAG